ncbi:hypothetical protein BaRGS_00034938, partial [Batillaria attramentaria]
PQVSYESPDEVDLLPKAKLVQLADSCSQKISNEETQDPGIRQLLQTTHFVLTTWRDDIVSRSTGERDVFQNGKLYASPYETFCRLTKKLAESLDMAVKELDVLMTHLKPHISKVWKTTQLHAELSRKPENTVDPNYVEEVCKTACRCVAGLVDCAVNELLQQVDVFGDLQAPGVETQTVTEPLPAPSMKSQFEDAVKHLLQKHLQTILGGEELAQHAFITTVSIYMCHGQDLAYAREHNTVPEPRFKILTDDSSGLRKLGDLDSPAKFPHIKEYREVRVEDYVRKETKPVYRQLYFAVYTVQIQFPHTGWSFEVETMSFPVLIRTGASQAVERAGVQLCLSFVAKNVLDPRVSVPATLKVEDVIQMMDERVRGIGGRGLQPYEKDHLREKLALLESAKGQDAGTITLEALIKDKVVLPRNDESGTGRKGDEMSFSLWHWFYAIINMLEQTVRQPWLDGVIYGFANRQHCEQVLRDKPDGTFLLRFSESTVQGCHENCKGALGVVGKSEEYDIHFLEKYAKAPEEKGALTKSRYLQFIEKFAGLSTKRQFLGSPDAQESSLFTTPPPSPISEAHSETRQHKLQKRHSEGLARSQKISEKTSSLHKDIHDDCGIAGIWSTESNEEDATEPPGKRPREIFREEFEDAYMDFDASCQSDTGISSHEDYCESCEEEMAPPRTFAKVASCKEEDEIEPPGNCPREASENAPSQLKTTNQVTTTSLSEDHSEEALSVEPRNILPTDVNVHQKHANQGKPAADLNPASPLPIFSKQWQAMHTVTSVGSILQKPGSDVVLYVPANAVVNDLHLNIYTAVCTDIDRVQSALNLPGDEFVVSPLVECITGHSEYRFKKSVHIRLPHFLPVDASIDQVRVYCITRCADGRLATTRLKPQSDPCTYAGQQQDGGQDHFPPQTDQTFSDQFQTEPEEAATTNEAILTGKGESFLGTNHDCDMEWERRATFQLTTDGVVDIFTDHFSGTTGLAYTVRLCLTLDLLNELQDSVLRVRLSIGKLSGGDWRHTLGDDDLPLIPAEQHLDLNSVLNSCNMGSCPNATRSTRPVSAYWMLETQPGLNRTCSLHCVVRVCQVAASTPSAANWDGMGKSISLPVMLPVKELHSESARAFYREDGETSSADCLPSYRASSHDRYAAVPHTTLPQLREMSRISGSQNPLPNTLVKQPVRAFPQDRNGDVFNGQVAGVPVLSGGAITNPLAVNHEKQAGIEHFQNSFHSAQDSPPFHEPAETNGTADSSTRHGVIDQAAATIAGPAGFSNLTVHQVFYTNNSVNHHNTSIGKIQGKSNIASTVTSNRNHRILYGGDSDRDVYAVSSSRNAELDAEDAEMDT